MDAKQVAKLTDDEVLKHAGAHGPAIIGQPLFDRAQSIQKKNPGGVLGPAIVGEAPADKPAKPAATKAAAKSGKKRK